MAGKDLRSRRRESEETRGQKSSKGGVLGSVLLAGLAVSALVVFKNEFPQLRRYMKVRNM